MASSFSMETIQAFFNHRVAELQTVQAAVMKGIETGNIQHAYDLPQSTIVTALGTLILAQLVLMLATKGGRSLVFKTIDTILAVILLAIILVIVLGLPFAVCYLSFKAAAFLITSFVQSPVFQNTLASVRAKLQ